MAGLLCFAAGAVWAQKSNNTEWWKKEVVYQIYPRSFKDSDGDGVGDLKGIISKLDYLKSLGITAVWINPYFASPNDDNGYDISDYRAIMKEFGTMDDFDAMLKGMHERNIKLVMDLVVNHSSDEHEWFKQSRSSRTSPYRDYYHWWPAEKGKPPYRYSLFDLNHDAWKYDATTDSYYLHYFSVKQPDLNWENPKLRQEVYDIMKFWAEKGVDGFRLDAFQFASKDIAFPEWPKGWEKDFVKYYAMGPHLHDYLKEMHEQVFSKYKVMSVAEGAGNTMQDAHNLVDAERKELNMAYAFEGVDIAKPDGYSLTHFKKVFSKWDAEFAEKGWLSIFLANHDQARMVTRFGNDAPEYRDLSSKMLTTFIMTMRGTPYYYNGDELAMTNIRFETIDDYHDVAGRNEYEYQKKNGGDLKKLLEDMKLGSRDNGRTPFQWNDTKNAGFTTGEPWLKVNPNYKTLNAAAQEMDPNSPLNYFRKVVALRKKNQVLVYGKYTLVDEHNPDIYAYTREMEGKKILVLLNFSKKNASTVTDKKLGKLLINNYSDTQKISGNKIVLRPYEARVYEVK
ncbi:MAG: alpha-glucosidase [Cytophagaceae bacterium]|nr:alpha-glucosidase [Cytophagaceae bacterium]